MEKNDLVVKSLISFTSKHGVTKLEVIKEIIWYVPNGGSGGLGCHENVSLLVAAGLRVETLHRHVHQGNSDL